MTVNTRHPRKKSAIAQGTTILGRNGFPVDTCVSFDSSITILDKVATAVNYTAPIVTVDNSVDLNLLINRTFKNTQLLSFSDAKGKKYYIDRNSINPTTRTFSIYTEFDATDILNITYSNAPTTIDLGAGWSIYELKWVNRLAVTGHTILENVEFAGVDMHLNLDGKSGDSVRIVDSDGHELDVNEDGSIKTDISITGIDIDAKDGDNIAISAHPEANQIFDEAADTITTAAFEEIYSYTSASDDLRLLAVECTVSTPATLVLKINGTQKRELRTSSLERNKTFYFREHRPLKNGDTVTVEAKVERLIKASYTTFTSLEGYICT